MFGLLSIGVVAVVNTGNVATDTEKVATEASYQPCPQWH